MKGKFIANINLMQIEATLKEHQPYAALVVSTTGLDIKNGFSEHSPTRVVLKEFEYDEELKSYKETIGFDRMVKAPQSAIDKAIENAANFDVFASGGIDRDKYIAGEGILTVEDFQKEFSSVISALKEDGAALIINGDRKFAETYLGKIGCADGIAELADNGKLVEQTRMTQEYFQKAGIVSKTAKLEDLRDAITVSPTGSFLKDDALMADYRQMSKDDFLKAHPDVTENKYFLTQRDIENRTGKIIGGDNRIDVINSFVTKYGRDEHILINEWQEQQNEAEAAYREDMSEKGKEKYKNADLDDKFKTLTEQGTLKPDDIAQGRSEFHKLINAVESKEKKGIIIMHAASTGFESGKPPKSTGFPIQFTALVYTRGEDGRLNMAQKPSGLSINIEAPSKSLQNAIKNINDPKRPYDTFKETGIDLEEYKAKVNVTSADDAVARVNKLFKKYPIEDYAIIAIGGTRGSDYSFTQTCMSNLGNFAMCEAPYIDFAQAIKDYSYLAHVDDKYPKNAMFDEFAFEGKGTTFALRDIAEARGDKRPASTREMCQETAKMIYLLEHQQMELFRPEELIAKEPEATPVVEKSVENSVPNAQSHTDEARSSDEEKFIDEGYNNVDEPEPSDAQLKAEKEAFREMMRSESQEDSSGGNKPSAPSTRPRKPIRTEPDEDLLANRRRPEDIPAAFGEQRRAVRSDAASVESVPLAARRDTSRAPSPLFDNLANGGRRNMNGERRPNGVPSTRNTPEGWRPSENAPAALGERRPAPERGMNMPVSNSEMAERTPQMPQPSRRQDVDDQERLAELLATVKRQADIIEQQSAIIGETNQELLDLVRSTMERQDKLIELIAREMGVGFPERSPAVPIASNEKQRTAS